MKDDTLPPYEPYIINYPGSVITLRRSLEEEEQDQAATAEIAIDALFTFCGDFCVPLAFDIETSYWNEEFDIPADDPVRSDRYGMLVQHPLPPLCEASALWTTQRIESAESVDRRTLVDYTHRVMSRREDDVPEFPIGWIEMSVRTTSVRLPRGIAGIHDDKYTLSDRARTVSERLSRRGEDYWAYGPQANTVNAPMEFGLCNDSDSLCLSISVMWSTWGVQGPGRAEIEKGLQRLALDRWK